MSDRPTESAHQSATKKYRDFGSNATGVGTQFYGETSAGAVIPLKVVDDGAGLGKVVIDSFLHSDLSDMPDVGGTNPDHDPRYYTKDEVNELVEGASFDFFLNNTGSDIGGYFVMDPSETGDAESSFFDTITGDAFLIDSFATSTTEPTFTELMIGIYSLHIHTETTVGANVKTVRLYYELYKRTHPGAVETLLVTSEESSILTNVKDAVEIHGSLTSDTVLASTDRLVVKIYANIEDGDPPRNTNPLVTLYAEGNLASRFEVKTTISAFDDRYVEVTGDIMTGNLTMNASTANINLTSGNDIQNFESIFGRTAFASNIYGGSSLALGTGATGTAGGSAKLNIFNASLQPRVDIIPGITLDLDLGDATHRFTDLFLSRNLSDGTNSLTVANAKTAFDYSQVGHLPLAGGTMAGNIIMGDNSITGVDNITFTDTGSIAGIENGNLVDKSTSESISQLWTFNKVPVGTGVSGGSLYINPASATANYTLLGLAVNGAEKFKIDEDGDLHFLDAAVLVDASANSVTVANLKTAFDHSQDNTQAHSDYLLNTGDDSTSGKLTATDFIASAGAISVISGQKILLEGAAGDTYIVFNSATPAIEVFLNNVKVWEF